MKSLGLRVNCTAVLKVLQITRLAHNRLINRLIIFMKEYSVAL